jgi:hypothetical protein
MSRITFGLLLRIGVLFALAMVILLTASKVDAREPPAHGKGDNRQRVLAESDEHSLRKAAKRQFAALRPRCMLCEETNMSRGPSVPRSG